MHRRPATALTALAAALLLGAPPAAAQTPDVAFDARPAAGARTDASGGWFSLPLAAGGQVAQALTVHNTSAEPLELAVAAVDATTMATGGASYAAPDVPAALTATWVELGATSLVLAPDERRDVPFTVRVPADAAPGDHLAGISLAAPSATGAASTTPNGTTTSIDLRTRRVVAVHVQVPGAAEPGIAVRGVEAVVRPPGPQLEIALENTGRRLVRGQGVLVLPDDGVRLELALDTFVPGTSIAYPVSWPEGLGAGTHAAEVELQHDGRTVRWQGEVTVTDDTVEAAVDAATPGTPLAAGAVPAGGTSPVLIGAAVLGGIAVAAGGQTAVRTLRRRAAA